MKARRLRAMILATLILILPTPKTEAVAPPVRLAEPKSLASDEQATLLRYARATWRSFELMAQPSGLVVDHLERDEHGNWLPSERTTPTDVASYIWSVLAAERLGILSAGDANQRLDPTLATLAGIERSHGFFINKFDPRNGIVLKFWPDDGTPVVPFLSTVENGWMAVALIMVRNTHPELRDRANAILGPMDFRFFYEDYDAADPENHPGQLRGGFWVNDGQYANPYGMQIGRAHV